MKEKLLYILSEKQGEYISGQELADRLSVSRAAIWKGIETLRKDGIPIEASTNRGYMLCSYADVLSSESIPEKARQSCGADKNKNLPRGWFHQHRGKRGGKTRRAGGLCCHIGKADRRLRQTGKAILFPRLLRTLHEYFAEA